MSKISCDIIQDLLPSLIDDVCSNDTKEVVKEHLASCEKCKMYKERMAHQDIQLNLKDNKQLDYMKKIRYKIDLKFIICFLLIIGFSLYALKDNYRLKYTFIVVPVLLGCNYLMFSSARDNKRTGMNKKVVGINCINLFVILYIPFLMIILLRYWMQYSWYPFGLELYNIGPFMAMQLKIIMVAEVIQWFIVAIIHMRTSQFYNSLSSMSIIGFYIALYFVQLIGGLDNVETYFRKGYMSFGIFGEGIIILVAYYIVNKFYKQRQRTKQV